MNLNWHVMEDPLTLARDLASQVGLWLIDDLAKQERASIAVSGGRTPVAFLRELSQTQLPWHRVDVTLVDERWVPVTDIRSNEALVREHLLRREAESARFIGLKTDHNSPEEGLESCRARLADLPLPLSVAILGMGLDGHTASWFTDSPSLREALHPPEDSLVVAQRPPSQPEPRITWTLPPILAARRRALHIEGTAKQQVFQQALVNGQSVASLPVRALLTQDLHLYWSTHDS